MLFLEALKAFPGQIKRPLPSSGCLFIFPKKEKNFGQRVKTLDSALLEYDRLCYHTVIEGYVKVTVDIDIQGAYEVNEAAQQLHVGIATVWRWIRERKLASFKLGNRTLVPAAAVEDLQNKESSLAHKESSRREVS
jgi:excisionase family DNA binding protein